MKLTTSVIVQLLCNAVVLTMPISTTAETDLVPRKTTLENDNDDEEDTCEKWLRINTGPPQYGSIETLPMYMFDEERLTCECELLEGTIDIYVGTCTSCEVCNLSTGICGIGDTQMIFSGSDNRALSIIETIDFTDGIDFGFFFFKFNREEDEETGETQPVCEASYNTVDCNVCEYRPCDASPAGLALYMDCTNIPELGDVRDRCVEDRTASSPHDGIFSLMNDDSICINSTGQVDMIPSLPESCEVVSSFDDGPDGWQAIRQEILNATYIDDGGNPGGYISGGFAQPNSFFYLSAPSKFHGNFSSSYGKRFMYDIKIDEAIEPFGFMDVIFVTGDGIAISVLAETTPSTSWTTVSIQLDTSEEWRLGRFIVEPLATETEILSVLSNLVDIRILAVYGDGVLTHIDNVKLEEECS